MSNIEERLSNVLSEHLEKNIRDGMRYGAKQEREKIAIFPFSIDEPVIELRKAILELIDEARVDENIACQYIIRSKWGTNDQLWEMQARLTKSETK